MGAAEDRADVPRTRPQEAGDLGVVVAVVVAEDERGADVGLEVGQRGLDEVAIDDRRRTGRRRRPSAPPAETERTWATAGTARRRTRRRRRSSSAAWLTIPWSHARSERLLSYWSQRSNARAKVSCVASTAASGSRRIA